MVAKVSGVKEYSIASELGITEGDVLISINDEIPQDIIDYNYLCKDEILTLKLEKKDGSAEEIEIEKDFDEELGIIFESAVFDRIKPCTNNCIFCFVEQQPEGLRDTLYVKDDDYRLSYLQGTYITTTNLTAKDKERISKLHLGPFCISVHTTNPDLRVKMLRNPKASKIMENLQWFNDNDIPFHAQIVLCPGYNDGKELERTLRDLHKFGNNLLSVAIVPVGLTCYRKTELAPVNKKIAEETIAIADKYKKVCCSDEFFLISGREIPEAKYYGNFSQLDDGVGSLRTLIDDFKSYKFPEKISKEVRICFACSVAAKRAFEFIATELNKTKNLSVMVKPVISTYWGNKITVAGLITSQDLINTVSDVDADYVVIPSIMLKPYSELFLDGRNLDYVRERTKAKIYVQQNNYSVREVLDFIKNL